jgi:hypothetical protein
MLETLEDLFYVHVGGYALVLAFDHSKNLVDQPGYARPGVAVSMIVAGHLRSRASTTSVFLSHRRFGIIIAPTPRRDTTYSNIGICVLWSS